MRGARIALLCRQMRSSYNPYRFIKGLPQTILGKTVKLIPSHLRSSKQKKGFLTRDFVDSSIARGKSTNEIENVMCVITIAS